MKNKILWAITIFAAWELCLGFSTLDSEFIVPSLLRICLGGVWILGFGKANNWFLEGGDTKCQR